MKLAYDTLMAVRAESSSKNKLLILKAAKDNVDLRLFLNTTYETRINFYMRAVDTKFATKPNGLSAPAVGAIEFNKDLIKNIVQKIAGRDFTGHAAKTFIANIHQGFANDWEREMLVMMIQRDAKIGVSANTVNKVWPGLVTDVPYQRCSLAKDLPASAAIETWPWQRGVYSQIKADGMYANISVTQQDKNLEVTIGSRNGSPFPMKSAHFAELIQAAKDFIPVGYQAHGELLIFRDGQMLARAIGNGIFNKVLQGGDLSPGDRIVYQVWDTIPLSEAKAKNKYKVKYKDRFAQLISWLAPALKDAAIRLIEYKMVYSVKEAYDHCREVMLRGLEGTVIKHPDAIWEDGTSQGQVKLKLEFVIELKVVGMNPGDKKSKNSELFGSLQAESACGKLRVGVPGYTDVKRKDIFDNWGTYQYSIIAVRCNGVMSPDAERGGFFSLFLPRFIEDRLDKTVADDLVRILEIQEDAINNAHLMGMPSEIK